MNVLDGLMYTKEHEWVKVEGRQAVIGITDYAQSSLGDITFVDLPKAGQLVKQFGQFGTVESVKAASDVYCPLSGKVTRVNEEIKNTPELINKSPFDKGWFIVVEFADESEKSKLLTAEQYRAYLKEHSK